MSPNQTQKWLLRKQATDHPVLSGPDSTFTLQTSKLPPLEKNQILIQTKYLSNDPAQRGWIDANIPAERLYRPPVQEGAVMEARGLGVVVGSESEKYKVGEWVVASMGWSEYAILDDAVVGLRSAPELPGGMGRTHYLGALGLTGITAYYGLVVVGEAKEGETVLVSGAAGATGSMVVQIAKGIVGAKKIIGIAGGKEKCKWVESIGADVCVDYKSSTFAKDLESATQGGVDVYFDNVGGEILDAALMCLKQSGRVAACGAVSAYNSGNAFVSKNWFQVVTMRIQIKGFIVMDYMHKAAEVIETFRKAMQEGKLKLGDEHETVVPTKFEEIPKTWTMLFSGGNQGKLITQL